LNELEVPDSYQAMRVAARIIAGEVAKPAPRARPRRRPLAIALATGLLIVFAFTPPGRAVTGEIAELVGIGDEPTETGDRDAVVIGTGEEGSIRYEVVATGASGRQIHPADGPPTPCIGVEFPGVPGPGGANCLTDAAMRGVRAHKVSRPFVTGAPAALYPTAEIVVQGLAVPGVTRVEVEYETADGEAEVAPAGLSFLDEDLSAAIAVTGKVAKSYVAFLPPTVLEPPAVEGGSLSDTNARQAVENMEAVAYDAAGNEVGREGVFLRNGALAITMTPPPARFADGDLVQRLRFHCLDELSRSTHGHFSDADIAACVDVKLQEKEGTE
jgi:hypothetical protein